MVLLEEVCDCLDQASGEEHPRLCRVDADVVEECVQLCGDELRRQFVNGCDAGGVLRRQRDDR